MLALFSMDGDLALRREDYAQPVEGRWLRSSGLLYEMSDLHRRGFLNGDWLTGAYPDQFRSLSLGYFLVIHAGLRGMPLHELSGLRTRLLRIGSEETPSE